MTARILRVSTFVLFRFAGSGLWGQSEPTKSCSRPRARDLGLEIGVLSPGPLNAITDVTGVRVGHYTLKQGTRFNTGVTAVLPHDSNLFHEKALELAGVSAVDGSE